MIAYFPEIYPDELMYSLFARYHVGSGHLQFAATTMDLFGKQAIYLNPDFFPKLTVDAYYHITKDHSIDTLIMKHTLLPYYLRFLPTNRKQCAYEYLKNMDYNFYNYLYIRQKKGVHRKFLRYCPACAAEDRKQYGETYWHTKHQLPEINICLKHHCHLENSIVELCSSKWGFKLIHAETVIPQLTLIRQNVPPIEYQIAQYVMQIFDADLSLRNNFAIGPFLLRKMEQHLLPEVYGKQVLAQKLYSEISTCYSTIHFQTITDWSCIYRIFCSKNFHIYDICLIAMLLGISADNLLNISIS